jgi:hypothetical protein
MITLPSASIAVHLKYRLCYIETGCCDCMHDWLLRIVDALNSIHIHGIRVPVEEPSMPEA